VEFHAFVTWISRPRAGFRNALTEKSEQGQKREIGNIARGPGCTGTAGAAVASADARD
jgi:hypothetical protein